ncbi:MAG TPA: cytochrome C oxidase subunit IV family protein [Elusimicrobiota bacterium]|nr:cytochrome C oxidase subunit IV family protein [Elusimicrobiota bacterium]
MTHDPITKRTYLHIYAALMALLAATVGAAFIPLGPFNFLITLTIAVTKAILVVLFFMHVRYNSRLIWIYVSLGFLWFIYLVGGTLSDVFTRT